MPDTEKRGRRHSCEVSVVVLDEVTRPAQSGQSRLLDPADVREDVFRSSGKGGQHRNKVETAIRLTHLPSSTVVTATEERSQHQNRAVAWARLAAVLEADAAVLAHEQTNAGRQQALASFRSFTWTGWRDEVRGPDGARTSMARALAGRLDPLLR